MSEMYREELHHQKNQDLRQFIISLVVLCSLFFHFSKTKQS